MDNLNGFKENVITGHLIPAGTGTEIMQSIRLKYLGTEIEPELPVRESERSVEEIAAAWRESENKSDAAIFGDEEEDSLPDEAKEMVAEFDDDAFADLDDAGSTMPGLTTKTSKRRAVRPPGSGRSGAAAGIRVPEEIWQKNR